MNRRKMNISLWSLGLVVLLTMAALVGATGTSLARYRAETAASLQFSAQIPTQIRLGQLVTDSESGETKFVPDVGGTWTQTDGQSRLCFAVSNMIDAEKSAAEDQQVSLRLVASAGIWDGTSIATVNLMIPRTDDSAQEPEDSGNGDSAQEQEPSYDIFPATAVRITVDSPLYNTFGDGWVFTFQDAEGEECSWLLEGGSLSVLAMTLVLEGPTVTDPSLLQLQFTANYS